MGGMGSGARQRLPEGRHEFDFRFVLPTLDLPTSFEGCAGSVRYFLKAELEESSKLTHRSVRAFSVIGKPKKVSWELMVREGS